MSELTDLAPELVSDFATVVLRCLRSTVGVEAMVAAVGAPPSSMPTVAVAIDFRGAFAGPVTWVFPPTVALELVRRLIEDPYPDADTIADGAAELANILSGSATEALEHHGFRCELGVPRMHEGALPSGVRVHMTSAAGPIEVVLSLHGVT